MSNNDLRGRRIVDSKPIVRAPLDEHGFPHGAGKCTRVLFEKNRKFNSEVCCRERGRECLNISSPFPVNI